MRRNQGLAGRRIPGFAGAVHLSKQEAFAACQALADADRFLLRAGCTEAARALGDLFELLEERMVADEASV